MTEKEQLKQKIVDLLHWLALDFVYGEKVFSDGCLTLESESALADLLVTAGYRLIPKEEDLPLLSPDEQRDSEATSEEIGEYMVSHEGVGYEVAYRRISRRKLLIAERHLIAEWLKEQK